MHNAYIPDNWWEECWSAADVAGSGFGPSAIESMSCTHPGWRSGSLRSHCAFPGTCGETVLRTSSLTSRPGGPHQHPATSSLLI